MRRTDLNDIQVFLVVAQRRGFTRAAARLGVSQSVLSHTIRQLEPRLGIRLLTRPTQPLCPGVRAGRPRGRRTSDGQIMVNSIFHCLDAALAGLGIADVPEPTARSHLAVGRLVQILADWCLSWPGQHLYYPDRRQSSAAFDLLVEALRHRALGAMPGDRRHAHG